jgi:hypothetical protein
MPRGDGTGPMGMGPMTGRAAGYCAGYAMPGFMNPAGRWCGGMGGAFGWDRGRGMGWASGFGRHPWLFPIRGAQFGPAPYAPAYSKEQEMDLLQNQANMLSDQLGDIQKRIQELEKEIRKDGK